MNINIYLCIHMHTHMFKCNKYNERERGCQLESGGVGGDPGRVAGRDWEEERVDVIKCISSLSGASLPITLGI